MALQTATGSVDRRRSDKERREKCEKRQNTGKPTAEDKLSFLDLFKRTFTNQMDAEKADDERGKKKCRQERRQTTR